MQWKTALADLAKASLIDIEEFADTAWRRFANRMQFAQPRQIMAYTGYGNSQYVWVHGRVLANRPVRRPADDDGWWDNLRATYERWESDEVAGAEVELSYGTQLESVVSDSEGYYEHRFDRDKVYPQDGVVVARLRSTHGTIVAQHKVALPDADAEYMIISDVDDTVIHTGITELLRAARLTFLNNARTRKPLAGIATLYRMLVLDDEKSARNPIFYVSNSGWNLYDLLRDFIELNEIPDGPLLLRDLGFGYHEDESSDRHKPRTIRDLMNRHPKLPVVMFGDSGQHDAELYTDVAAEYGDRVLAIYIRDVDPRLESSHDARVREIIHGSSGSGIPMLLGSDSSVFAGHMQSIELLSSSERAAVEEAVARDNARRDGLTNSGGN